MKIFKNKHISLAALFISIICLLSACGSKKTTRIELPADFKGPKELQKLYGVRITPSDNIFLYNEGARWLGVAHRMGGSDKRGIDCSGFVNNVYSEVYGKRLSRSSADMLKRDCKKISRNNLQEGDLVFFNTAGKRTKTPNHVGIYLKNEKFIHTSTSQGVIVSSLSEPYYLRTWIGAGRVK